MSKPSQPLKASAKVVFLDVFVLVSWYNKGLAFAFVDGLRDP